MANRSISYLCFHIGKSQMQMKSVKADGFILPGHSCTDRGRALRGTHLRMSCERFETFLPTNLMLLPTQPCGVSSSWDLSVSASEESWLSVNPSRRQFEPGRVTSSQSPWKHLHSQVIRGEQGG